MNREFDDVQQRLRAGDILQAEAQCRRELDTHPESAQLWHILGICQAMQGELPSATASFQQAVALDSTNATYYYNLGLAHKSTHHLSEAAAAYGTALELQPGFLEAANNLGNTLMELGDMPAAIDCFLAILEQHPHEGTIHFNLANLLQDTGKTDAAVAHYHQALKLDPDNIAARENLGRAFADEGRYDEAQQVWREWLEQNPDSAIAQHMLLSVSGENAPERCADQYIRETFDENFAKSFDQQLARLGYQAPEHVQRAVQTWVGQKRDLEILDAGCGTGLCGPRLRPLATRLIGVDLSEPMLEVARQREVYDQTVAIELTQYLAEHTQSFDLIVSADTVCYFGELARLLNARQSLKPAGGLVFTVEMLADGESPYGFRLQRSGRYAHASTYIAQQLVQADFHLVECEQVTLRKEIGQPVLGWLVTAIVAD